MSTTVEYDAQGLPQRFLILPYGPGTLTIEGQTTPFEFTPELAAAILAHAATKDEAIPIDCEHASFHLAESLAHEEGILAATPLLGERLACGFVRLAADEAGLWARVESWTPRAATLLREKNYRYFSPVLRGLRDGHPRITSIALTNQPALDRLDPLVARGEPGAGTGQAPHRQGDPTVDKLAELLGRLLGSDALPLSASGPAAAEAAAARLEEHLRRHEALVEEARQAQACLELLREPLALGAEPSLALLGGQVLSLVERAAVAERQSQDSQRELAGLKAARVTEERQQLLEQGLRSGRLTPALVEAWAGQQDLAVLRAFLEHAPAGALVPVGRLPLATLVEEEAEALPPGRLEEIAHCCGLDPERVRQH